MKDIIHRAYSVLSKALTLDSEAQKVREPLQEYYQDKTKYINNKNDLA